MLSMGTNARIGGKKKKTGETSSLKDQKASVSQLEASDMPRSGHTWSISVQQCCVGPVM